MITSFHFGRSMPNDNKAPETLPADFDFSAAPSAAPDTLPASFDFKSSAASSAPDILPADFDFGGQRAKSASDIEAQARKSAGLDKGPYTVAAPRPAMKMEPAEAHDVIVSPWSDTAKERRAKVAQEDKGYQGMQGTGEGAPLAEALGNWTEQVSDVVPGVYHMYTGGPSKGINELSGAAGAVLEPLLPFVGTAAPIETARAVLGGEAGKYVLPQIAESGLELVSPGSELTPEQKEAAANVGAFGGATIGAELPKMYQGAKAVIKRAPSQSYVPGEEPIPESRATDREASSVYQALQKRYPKATGVAEAIHDFFLKQPDIAKGEGTPAEPLPRMVRTEPVPAAVEAAKPEPAPIMTAGKPDRAPSMAGLRVTPEGKVIDTTTRTEAAAREALGTVSPVRMVPATEGIAVPKPGEVPRMRYEPTPAPAEGAPARTEPGLIGHEKELANAERSPEDLSKVDRAVFQLTNQELLRLGRRFGLDESKYDFSKREGVNRHTVDRDLFSKHTQAKLPANLVNHIVDAANAWDSKDTNVFDPASMNSKFGADRSRAIMGEAMKRWQAEGAPEGPAETAPKLSQKAGTTPSDLIGTLTNVQGANPRLVGSRATGKVTPMSDTDVLIDTPSHQFEDAALPALEKAGYQSHGSSIITAKEAAEYDKPIHAGTSRVQHLTSPRDGR
jgi:hypothetical protein